MIPPDDSHSLLKQDVEIHNPSSSSALASTAPPPYTPVPPPNPIPSYQSIPQSHPVASQASQTIVLTLPSSRRSPIRRFLVAFAVATLVLFLWGTFMESLGMVRHFRFRRHEHSEIASEREGFHQLPTEMDDTGRVLPIRYPLNQPPPRQMTG